MKKIFLFFCMFILIFGSTCFGGQNLTGNEFRELLKQNGISILDSTEIPSNVVTSLNLNPLIITSEDKTKVYIFETSKGSASDGNVPLRISIVPYKNNNVLGYYVGATTNYTYQTSIWESCWTYNYQNYYLYNVTFDVVNQTFSSNWYTSSRNQNTKNISNNPSSATIGYNYDSNVITEADFKSIKNLKNYLYNHCIFNGSNSIIYGTGGVDLFYKWNGVFKGNEINKPYTSKFSLNEGMYRFDYTAFTDLSENDYNIVNYFFLQEFTPNQAVNLSDEDLGFTSEDYAYPISYSLTKDFSFNSLVKKMQQGYIYRLYCFSNIGERSGDNSRTSDATSCFFSLNTWKSSSITVVNLYDYLGISSDDIVLVPDEKEDLDSGDSGFDIQGGIDSINNNIQNTILGTPDESGERKGGLLGGILDGIKGLFVPDSEAINEWIQSTQHLTEDSLGAISYPLGFYRRFIQTLIGAPSEDLIFYLPEFKLPTSDVVIWDSIEFNITEFIQKYEPLKVFYNSYLVIVSGLGIWMFLQYLWSLYESFINGHESAHQVDEALDTVHNSSYASQRRFMDTYRRTGSQDEATQAYYSKRRRR